MRIGFNKTILAIALFLPFTANAAVWEFVGGLNIDQSVASTPTTSVPVPYYGGGFVSAYLDDETGDFAWDIFFGGLSGDATAAHFHIGAPGVAGGVALGVSVPAASSGTAFGSVVLDGVALDAAVAELTGGGAFDVGDATDWYLNIHTDLNIAGELRGQLFVDGVSAVPVPAAVWMMISAIGVLFGTRRNS